MHDMSESEQARKADRKFKEDLAENLMGMAAYQADTYDVTDPEEVIRQYLSWIEENLPPLKYDEKTGGWVILICKKGHTVCSIKCEDMSSYPCPYLTDGHEMPFIPCSVCHGRGEIFRDERPPDPQTEVSENCEHCKGTGQFRRLSKEQIDDAIRWLDEAQRRLDMNDKREVSTAAGLIRDISWLHEELPNLYSMAYTLDHETYGCSKNDVLGLIKYIKTAMKDRGWDGEDAPTKVQEN